MAADRWVPPLDILGELYETASALSDPQRTVAERIDAVEAAAAAADAWRTYLCDFLQVEIKARLTESCQRRDFTSVVMKSDQWQSLPVNEKQTWMLRDAHFDQRTADITGMAQRMAQQRREAAGIKGSTVCPRCELNGPPTDELSEPPRHSEPPWHWGSQS